MNHWQPIETARKDNKAILVWCPENRCQYMVTWNDGWFIFGGFTRLTRDVTHWRELPSSPGVEPQPQQPLRWVENCKPDKPGIWARRGGIVSVHVVTNARENYDSATRCYLGPIPEILSPKKKVTERLWLVRSGSCGHGCSAYYEHWLGYDDQPTESGDWIRTDRTREVER